MKTTFWYLAGCLLLPIVLSGQNVGIGTTDPHGSAGLEVSSINQGILIPRMTTSSIGAIPAPAKGLMVYDTTMHILTVNMGTPGAPDWRPVSATSAWNLTGNSGLNAATHFIGTTDNKPLYFRMNNKIAGKLDSVYQSSFYGYQAGRTQGGFGNTAIGFKTLYSNTTGDNNIVVGSTAMFANTSGDNNIAIGTAALYSNTTGYSNTATGFLCLYYNTSGSYNTATGGWSLMDNTTGSYNTATGYETLESNTIGQKNVAAGFQSMSFNTTGSNNTASGYYALRQSSTGSFNAAFGDFALTLNYSGAGNTAMGSSALFTSSANYNTAVGFNAGRYHFLGWNNTFIGSESNANANGIFNSVALGASTQVTASNQVRIGNTSTTSIGGYTNWSNISDGRYKNNIRENVQGLAFILKLRPVTYQLDVQSLRAFHDEPSHLLEAPGMAEAIDQKSALVQSGFIAQEVEAAAAAIGFDFSGVDTPKHDGDLYALRYAEFVVPLVKAIQEQQVQIDALRRESDLLRGQVEQLAARPAVVCRH